MRGKVLYVYQHLLYTTAIQATRTLGYILQRLYKQLVLLLSVLLTILFCGSYSTQLLGFIASC